MQKITFSNSRIGHLRAHYHEIAYKANNAFIDWLKIPVVPKVVKWVDDILGELPNLMEITIFDTLDTAQLKKGDIVRILLKPNTTPDNSYAPSKPAALTLSIKSKIRTPQASIVSAYVFSQNEISGPLTPRNEARLPPTLHSRIDRSWGKKSSTSLTPPSNKIGKFEIPVSDIQVISLHQTPMTRGFVNQLKRGFNQFLDLFKAQTKIRGK